LKFLRIIKIGALSMLCLLLLIVAGASAYVYVNEDNIYNMLLDELNSNQVGHTEVGRVDVSPFENFPYVSIGLHDVRFFADKAMDETPIYQINDVYLGFDLWDILQGEYTIKKLKIRGGFLRMVIDEAGQLNLSLAKADKVQEEGIEPSERPLHLDLKAMEFENFKIEEINLQGSKHIDLDMVSVRAEFSSVQDFIRMAIKGDLLLNQYTASGVEYFKNKPFSLDTRFTYDLYTELLAILPGKLLLDDGSLDFSGNIDFRNDLDLDIALSGKKKNFDLFISFAPDDIAEKLKRFRNEGDIYFSGSISGPSINADPAIDIRLGCENTFFFHMDESKAVKDLAFEGRFHTGAQNSLETAEFILSNLYGVPETGYFSGTIRVVNFLNPAVSIDFHADVDLSHFQSFYDPDWLIDAGGRLRVDITINEFVEQDSVIHVASKMEDGTLSRIEFDNAWMQFSGYHETLENMEGKIVIDGDNLLLEKLYCKVGESDLMMTASLAHFTDLLHHQASPLDLSLHLESGKIDVAGLLPLAMRDSVTAWKTEVITDLYADFDVYSTVDALYNYSHLPEVALTIRHCSGQLQGFEQPLRRLGGKITTSDERIEIDDLTLVIGDSDLHLNLQIDQPYLFMEPGTKGAAHFHTAIIAEKIDFKPLLHYRGRSLVDPDVEAQLGGERVQQLHLECDGYVHPSSFSANGFRGYCNIEKFTVQLNDHPKLHHASGKLRADTTGCLHIEGFKAQLGRSDIYADLQLLHLLDTLGDKREIYGSLGGKLWDFDEYFSTSVSTTQALPVEAALDDSLKVATNHQVGFNVFALPFPQMDIKVDVEKIVNERYLFEAFRGHFRASPDHMVWIDTLHFKAAGGHIGISGYLNGSIKEDLYMAGQMELQHVDIDQVFFKMDNFGQDYLVSNQLHGQLDGQISMKAHLFPDLSPMLDRTEAKMNIKITDGRLENFAPMQAMSDFMGERNLNNISFADMENNFEYANGNLLVPKMKIASTLGFIHLSGKQGADERIDYEIQVPMSLVKSAGWNMLKQKLSGSKKKGDQADLEEVEEEIISEQKGLIQKYMTFKVTGTVDDFEVGMGKNKALKNRP
jgi:hypothetical protein